MGFLSIYPFYKEGCYITDLTHMLLPWPLCAGRSGYANLYKTCGTPMYKTSLAYQCWMMCWQMRFSKHSCTYSHAPWCRQTCDACCTECDRELQDCSVKILCDHVQPLNVILWVDVVTSLHRISFCTARCMDIRTKRAPYLKCNMMSSKVLMGLAPLNQ